MNMEDKEKSGDDEETLFFLVFQLVLLQLSPRAMVHKKKPQ